MTGSNVREIRRKAYSHRSSIKSTETEVAHVKSQVYALDTRLTCAVSAAIIHTLIFQRVKDEWWETLSGPEDLSASANWGCQTGIHVRNRTGLSSSTSYTSDHFIQKEFGWLYRSYKHLYCWWSFDLDHACRSLVGQPGTHKHVPALLAVFSRKLVSQMLYQLRDLYLCNSNLMKWESHRLTVLRRMSSNLQSSSDTAFIFE